MVSVFLGCFKPSRKSPYSKCLLSGRTKENVQSSTCMPSEPLQPVHVTSLLASWPNQPIKRTAYFSSGSCPHLTLHFHSPVPLSLTHSRAYAQDHRDDCAGPLFGNTCPGWKLHQRSNRTLACFDGCSWTAISNLPGTGTSNHRHTCTCLAQIIL